MFVYEMLPPIYLTSIWLVWLVLISNCPAFEHMVTRRNSYIVLSSHNTLPVTSLDVTAGASSRLHS